MSGTVCRYFHLTVTVADYKDDAEDQGGHHLPAGRGHGGLHREQDRVRDGGRHRQRGGHQPHSHGDGSLMMTM